MTSASIKTTMIVPVHTPALKMPPITSQLETITVTIIKSESSDDVFCFILNSLMVENIFGFL